MAQDNSSEIEKLLALAEQSVTLPKEVKKCPIKNYINKFDIKGSEDDKVLAMVIYYHYCQYKKRNPVSRLWFFKHFSKYFDVTTKSNEVAYRVSSEPFDISQEGMFKARAHLRKEKKRAKEKKASKSKGIK